MYDILTFNGHCAVPYRTVRHFYYTTFGAKRQASRRFFCFFSDALLDFYQVKVYNKYISFV